LFFDDNEIYIPDDFVQSSSNDFYNTNAIIGDYSQAQFDKFGNPIGGAFDLAKDGAFKGYSVLIGCFYHGEEVPDSIRDLSIPALQQKGFTVELSLTEQDFITNLKNKKFDCAWIISSNIIQGPKDDFYQTIMNYHKTGGGLFIFGDNDPFFEHANLLTPDIAGCSLEGNTPGGNTLVPGDPHTAGFFGNHLITTGVTKLFEGVTICFPSILSKELQVVGTSSNNHPLLVVKEAHGDCGRVVIDNGFTKLMASYWETAGTPRYISNCCAWLIHIESKVRKNK